MIPNGFIKFGKMYININQITAIFPCTLGVKDGVKIRVNNGKAYSELVRIVGSTDDVARMVAIAQKKFNVSENGRLLRKMDEPT